MTGEGTLWVIAEISIGFAGFTGVVAVFGQQTWSALNRYRFTALWATSLTTMLFALFPLLLSYCGLTEPKVWRYSSVVIVLVLTIVNCVELPRAWRLRTHMPQTDKITLSGLTFVLFAAIGGLVWNATSHAPTIAPYMAALIYMLLVASTMFVRLLSSHVSGNIDEA
ncbi:MAG: hypothetical protein AAF541_12245 [Pseudomonadota bacterium]